MPKIDPEALRAARERQKPSRISQGGLAGKMGVTQRTVASWEGRKPDGSLPQINEKNLQKLARVLNVSIKQLTGEEPIGPDHQRSKHRLTAQISSTALFGYDILEHRYGLTKEEVIEAAPMLFEALNHVFLQKRQEKLSAVRKLASTIEAIVPNPMHHTLVFNGHVPGWNADEWGLEASLNFEQSEIERSSPFTESGWSEVHNGCSSNRFYDMLLELGVPAERLVVILEEGVAGFPDYLVGLRELRELTGVRQGEPVSPRAKQVACALVERAVKIAEVPPALDDDARTSWLAERVVPTDPQDEYEWQPFPEYFSQDVIPSHSAFENGFPRGLGVAPDANGDGPGIKAFDAGDGAIE